MSVPEFQHAVVVLGMHRSGTSALAGLLGLAGLAMPRTLLPASSGNERGFWESEALKSFNEDVFKDFGTSWHGLASISPENLRGRALTEFRKRARSLLTDEYGGSTTLVVKDPRMSRLMPLWRPIIAEMAAAISYPIILRSPLEVAQSLSLRNDFDPGFGLLLWTRYLLDAEAGTRGSKRAFLTYDRLLENWRSELIRIDQKLGLPFEPAAIDDDEVSEFLSSGLRHHRVADEQVFIELEHSPQVLETYSVLLGWAKDQPESNVDYKTLDRIRKEIDRTGALVSKVVERSRLDRKRVNNFAAQLAQAKRASTELEEVRATLGLQSEAQNRLERQLEKAVSSLSGALEERVALESAVKESLEARQSIQFELDSLRAEAVRNAESYERELAEVRERSHRELNALVSDLEALRSRRALEIEDADKQLKALSAKQKELETELKDVKRKYRSTQHQLGRDQEKLRKSQARLEEADATIQKMRHSFAWRVTSLGGRFLGKAKTVARRFAGGGGRKLRAAQLRELRSSSYFDADWYLSRYSDVADANADAALHYLQDGWREGRDPGPDFSTKAYLKANPDVTKSGQNPLLHYIEFGHSEGRSISRQSATGNDVQGPEFKTDFPPAAPCIGFPLTNDSPIRWTRAARLDVAQGDLFSAGGLSIGYESNVERPGWIQAEFDLLALLSGQVGARTGQGNNNPTGRLSLVDGWHAGDGRLRTRWSAQGDPIIIRAYQHDPVMAGALKLVGEGLIASNLDFLDANLGNQLFPVLFVSSQADGTIRGSRLLAFPSLCRGGAHYAEMLAVAATVEDEVEPLDLLAHSEMLADALLSIIEGEARPLIESIVVDLSGGNGSESLFRADFQAWLSNVMRVGVKPELPQSHQRNGQYLADAVQLDGARKKAAGKLKLAAGMTPTIDALVATQGDGDRVDSEVVLPMLIAGAEPSQPAMLVKFPHVGADSVKPSPPNYPMAWGRFLPSRACRFGGSAPVAAIRGHQDPSDAELLVPVAQPIALSDLAQDAITWLVATDDQTHDQLSQILEALLLQQVSQHSNIALIGEDATKTLSQASDLFTGRAKAFSDIVEALREVATPLIGYVGHNVILHDDRTANLLAKMLEDGAAVSASCVLVATEKHGKGWRVAVADGGTVSGLGVLGDLAGPKHFWRSNYPAALPPRHFWMARSSDVRGWLQRAGPLRSHEGMHVCTSLVTASLMSRPHEHAALLRPPVAQRAPSLERLF